MCRPLCPYGQFGLPNMNLCHKWLKCAEIEKDVKVQEPLDNGAVKAVCTNSCLIYLHILSVFPLRGIHVPNEHGYH